MHRAGPPPYSKAAKLDEISGVDSVDLSGEEYDTVDVYSYLMRPRPANRICGCDYPQPQAIDWDWTEDEQTIKYRCLNCRHEFIDTEPTPEIGDEVSIKND